jgi:hypothetical protein
MTYEFEYSGKYAYLIEERVGKDDYGTGIHRQPVRSSPKVGIGSTGKADPEVPKEPPSGANVSRKIGSKGKMLSFKEFVKSRKQKPSSLPVVIDNDIATSIPNKLDELEPRIFLPEGARKRS